MPQRGFQKTVTVKLYPEEIQALEVIAKLAGWDGKSTALREFMKIWIETAVIAIESKSTAKGSLQMLKSMIRINKQIDTIQKKAKIAVEKAIAENNTENTAAAKIAIIAFEKEVKTGVTKSILTLNTASRKVSRLFSYLKKNQNQETEKVTKEKVV